MGVSVDSVANDLLRVKSEETNSILLVQRMKKNIAVGQWFGASRCCRCIAVVPLGLPNNVPVFVLTCFRQVLYGKLIVYMLWFLYNDKA